MKKLRLIILALLPFVLQGQSWQWGKRGGALEALSTGNRETIYSLITDSHKNIYGLSKVGSVGLTIDSSDIPNFDTGSYPYDYALSSFGCDGSYRWSKIIAGIGEETVHLVQVDNQNNIYIAGRFGDCTNNNPTYHARIGDDFINNYDDCRLLFLAKYNDSGVLQWIRRPQIDGVDFSVSYSTITSGLQTDALGNSYWLMYLPPGTYADGAFVNTQEGNHWFILKYDTNGNYTGNIPLDMQITGGFGVEIHFQRNPYNGHFYFYSSNINDTGTAIIAGNAVTHETFFTSFDAQGNYLWKREDSFTNWGYLFLYNLAFDPQNNIYIGGEMVGYSMGSFLGYSITDDAIPGFVMKTNPDASQVIWASNNNSGADNTGGIVLNGNELAYTSYCGGTNFTWGTQTLNVSAVDGTKVLLARFNKNTGACIALTNIPGTPGYYDNGSAITADASGDYIVGGAVAGTLYVDNNQQVQNGGSQTDFFVAKYATQACSPLAVNENEEINLKVYPNPTTGDVFFDNSSNQLSSVTVFNYLGQVVKKQALFPSSNESIEIGNLSQGVYLLEFAGVSTSTTVKVIKE